MSVSATAVDRPATGTTDDGLEAAARQAGVLSQASQEVSDTSRQAAESLGELRAAIGHISTSTTQASTVAGDAAEGARDVDARILALQDASAAISEVVSLITGLSQQSRMLGLNASIEAARAGEVGRGFAVVADEVKQLAGRTAQAAQSIAEQIETVQQETREAVAAVRRITGTLAEIARAQDSIAAAVEQQRVAADRVVAHVERAAGGSARITRAVAELAESQRRVFVQRALQTAQELLAEAGGVALGERREPRTVRDQATGAARTVELPELLVGGVPLSRDDDPRRRAPLVDDVVARVGGSCTLFQRLDDDGSMVRAATTVLTAAGRRNVGTSIGRLGPDGTPHPVLAAVLAGRTWTGEALVAGRSFFTAYAPLAGDGGELVGMLYVGLPLEEM